MIDPQDQEFFVGRHLQERQKQTTLQEFQRKGLMLRQQMLFAEKRKLDTSYEDYKKGCAEIRLESLQNSALMQNFKFSTLIRQLENHNRDIRNVKNGKFNPIDLQLQCEFNAELFKLLNHVLAFSQVNQQLQYLDQIFQWILVSRNIKSYDKGLHNSQGTMDNQMQTHLLPSDITKQEISQYQKGARTWHQDIDPSSDRLKNYHYRKIISSISTASTTKHIDERGGRIFPPAYPKNDYMSSFVEAPKEDDGINNLLSLKNVIQENKEETPNQENSNDAASSIAAGAKAKSVSLAPARRNFLRDSDRRPFSLQRDYEAQSIYLSYNPNDKEQEMHLNRRWLIHKNKELRQQKEDEEMVIHMSEWGKNRSRIEKEINRRIDNRIQGSNYAETFKKSDRDKKDIEKQFNSIFQPTTFQKQETEPQDSNRMVSQTHKNFFGPNHFKRNTASLLNPQFIDLSSSRKPEESLRLGSQITQSRVKNLIKNNQHILNLSRDMEDREESCKPLSLSVYDKPEDLNQVNRPLSVVYQSERGTHIEQQLQEVYEVKQRLAKYKIVVPTKRLMNSLVTPQIHATRLSQNQDVPSAGYGLSLNPFDDDLQKRKSKSLGSKKKRQNN